ncbi:MAG: DUF4340 domain-containing protein [Pirellulaceae bacterium]|nr:DUF4340 domain-containing protein [Pirellulaceae bacterium]
MSEMVKTLIYVGSAAVLALVALLWQPGQVEQSLDEKVGQDLFETFDTADNATSLTITRYDTNFDKPIKFQVNRSKATDQWVIPSEDNYPADAEEQMQKAATALINLEVLGIASETPKDHKLYGVVEPADDLAAGSIGVGMLVEVANAKKDKLAELIIGKTVADEEAKRFVRVRTEDVTYVVKLDVTNFSTTFNEWIESDLLSLNPLDIRSLALKDYSILEVLDPRTGGAVKQLMQRSDTALNWNQEESKWNIGHMHEFKEANQPTSTEMAENEELNTERLNELKNALDDLKIVGVREKPDDTNQVQLQQYGFYPFPTKDENGEPIDDVRSANGEVHVSLQDGIQYILRFGDIAPPDVVQSSSEDSSEEIYRYLVVMAKLDPSQLSPPELQPEITIPAPAEEKPAEKTPPKAAPPKAAPEKAAPEKKAPEKAAPEKAAPEKAAPEKKAPEKKPADEGGCGDDEEKAKQPAAKQPAAKQPAAKQPAAKEKPVQPPADPQAPATKPGEAPQEKPVTLSPEELLKAQEAVKKENERKLNEYKEKLAAAEKRVLELNARFAGWCFIIDEKVYNQIHLSQSDVIKEKGGAEIDNFRNLDPNSLQPPGPTPPGGNLPLPQLPPQP